VGGELSILTHPAEGTEVVLNVPVPSGHAGGADAESRRHPAEQFLG